MSEGKKQKNSTLSVSDFVHLHNHTHYSLLDGLQKVAPMVEAVHDFGMQAVAVTDHGTLSGVIEFYKEAVDRGVKPILGIETYVASRTHRDKEAGKDKQNYHLTVLAMNNLGYQNLMRLSTTANLDGFYYRPRIDLELLKNYNEGLIVLSGCIGGELGDLLRQDQYEQAKDVAMKYKAIFGDRYYIEVQDHGHPDHPGHWNEQKLVNDQLFSLASELGIKVVVTCDSHYLRHEDQEAHEILLCVQTGSFLSDPGRMSLKNFELHLTDPNEIIARWGETNPEVITNTKEIAERCSVQLELGKILIPKFPVPKGENEKTYLHSLVYQGLAWRYGGVIREKSKHLNKKDAEKTLPADVRKRASYELAVIDQMGFNGYFLIIADFINWGKDRGIVFGPGRGSAAGSIISFALNITTLDPIKYDLLFERFLNPDRISMPDIDIDIQDTRRDEVIQYCVEKYGSDRVANIVSFGKMAARNAVRDVARVMQVPYAEADRMAKMIPPPVQGRHIPLEKSLEENADLKNEYNSSDISKRVFDLAVKVEGTIRSHGVHAAGVVIAPDDIVKFAPLEMAQKGVVTTQYSMGPIEELGLLKMDFLGLSNLTIIKNTLRIVKRVYDQDVDINELPLDDQKTYELLRRGDTTGVFQFESSGMKKYLKDLKPTEFADIVAMGALYRPGPLSAGLTDSFIKRKNGLEKVVYDHPTMKAALESTFGVLVYQEQFMQISRDVCGFTGGEADTLRKAIGKKKRDVMAKMETRFIEGAVANGIDRQMIEAFWKKLLGFADYCFNKSHSACYGMISYWTAYLKAHYPDAFMAALMTSDSDDTDRLSIEISECLHQGIKVLAPDVNESFAEFAVVPGKNSIRFGMAAIKNVGSGAADEIVQEREKNGPYKNLEDFFTRCNGRVVNKKVIESLIKTGGFDGFGDRGLLLENIDNILAFSSKKQKELDSGQTDLFGSEAPLNEEVYVSKISLMPVSLKIEKREQLLWERELLGLYLSEHPLQDFRLILGEKTVPMRDAKADMHDLKIIVGGTITSIRQVTTKNGQQMAFVRLADETQELEVVIFPKVYELAPSILQQDAVVIVEGKIDATARDGSRSDEIKIMANKIREVTHDQAMSYKPSGKSAKLPKPSVVAPQAGTKPKRLFIRLSDSTRVDLLEGLKTLLDQHIGDTEVVLVTGPNEAKKVVKIPYKLDIHETSIRAVADLFGADNVKLH